MGSGRGEEYLHKVAVEGFGLIDEFFGKNKVGRKNNGNQQPRAHHVPRVYTMKHVTTGSSEGLSHVCVERTTVYSSSVERVRYHHQAPPPPPPKRIVSVSPPPPKQAGAGAGAGAIDSRVAAARFGGTLVINYR